MRIPIYQIDAFTSEQFKGNPAAVCPLEDWIEDALMQNIAAENNLAETAFFVKKISGEYELRWFTPKGEIDLCGHATLASAFVICTYLEENMRNIKFHTKSGVLEVAKSDSLFTLTFPSREGSPCDTPEALVKGLGKKPKKVFMARDYLAVFETEQDILDLEPNMDELLKLDGLGVIATAPGTDADFVSRFFAPKMGIPEDPVTGSAHCTLVPYWKNRLSKNQFNAVQVSERGGKLYCTLEDGMVKISGEAVAYLEGTILV